MSSFLSWSHLIGLLFLDWLDENYERHHWDAVTRNKFNLIPLTIQLIDRQKH